MAIPIVVITAFLSPEIIRVLYGEGYAQSDSALTILIWTSLFIFPNILLVNLFIVANKQRLNAAFALVCLLVNVALNYFLIPRYGFIGSSVATVATDMLLFILSAYFVTKYFVDLRLIRDSVKPVLGGVMLVGLLTVMHGLDAVYRISAAVAFYTLFVFVTKTLSINDVIKLKGVLQRR